MARGGERIRASETADALSMSVGEKDVNLGKRRRCEEITCADDEEVEREGSLRLEGKRTGSGLGYRDERHLRGEGGEVHILTVAGICSQDH